MKTQNAIFFIFFAAVLAGTWFYFYTDSQPDHSLNKTAVEHAAGQPDTALDDMVLDKLAYDPARMESLSGYVYDIERRGFASQYLISHFAHHEYDWGTANKYIDKVLETDPESEDLLNRAMILNMGSGEFEEAVEQANRLITMDPDNSLGQLILTIDNLRQNKYAETLDHIAAMPDGEITDFMRPMLRAWALAGQGNFQNSDYQTLAMTTLHLYSGAMIALYEGNIDQAREFANTILAVGRITPHDAERVADIFIITGDSTEALALYEGSFGQSYRDQELSEKIQTLKEDGDMSPYLTHLSPESPAQGAAVALYDMARILYQEYSDSSARLFVNMALALDPDFKDARLLLANVLARNGRYDKAIENFATIKPDDGSYLGVQRHIASLMQDDGREDDAKALLTHLFAEYNDIDAMIALGDFYRSQQDYTEALKAYNKAAEYFEDGIPEEYWHLLYARGMTYEREGEWGKAESDLKAALKYRPDHPYLLNYLGYGWADQGTNLEESLSLIQRAAVLRPGDAYIRDSLGWVLYMMERYQEAIPHLEAAVELLPYDPTLNEHLGDAYWQVRRYTEAEFQWRRAMNNAEDPVLVDGLAMKLEDGLVSTDLSGITGRMGVSAEDNKKAAHTATTVK